MSVQTKPNIWQRLLSTFDIWQPPSEDYERAAWPENGQWEHHDLMSDALATPQARRAYRDNADMVAVYGAVYAAIRRRVRAIVQPRIVLTRTVGADSVDVDQHPFLDALRRVNEGLTYRQGMGLIEQHKLTTGKAFWVKRRNGLGVPVEFEMWQPENVEVIPDKRKSWVPAAFKLHRANGNDETVAMIDMIWFRHLIDPRNSLNGLGPIGAVRVQLDTGLEAQRFNQRFFDNSTNIGQIFNAVDAEPAEVARVEKELDRKFKSTDKAHRSLVIGGEMKLMGERVSHKDMEFLEQMRWGVEEVARVFEMAPELLAAGARTYENAPSAMTDFWTMIVDQLTDTCEEFNEFCLHPDFGEEYNLVVRTDNIPALQEDRKLRAEVDEIYLRTGKTYINALRERDGEESVAWGDLPLLPNNVAPLGSAPPPAPNAPPGPPRSYQRASVDDAETEMTGSWEKRLQRELSGIIGHLTKADKRTINVSDVNLYDWDWRDDYGKEVAGELQIAYAASLEAMGFVETPLMGVQQIAERYARARSSELLAEGGRYSVSATTREAVREMVADTIAKGDSLQTLQKKLRESFAFGRGRAETIARTETSRALGKASMQSFESRGVEGKRWITARDDRVCAFCQAGAGDGVIALARYFSNGAMDTGDSHVRCRCKLEPSLELPRASSNGHKAEIGAY